MLSNTRNQNISYEKQTKFIQDRISSVEKNFSELCNVFGMYARKVARVRDGGDDLCKVLQSYADAEAVNKSLSTALADVSTTLSAIEDYRNAYVQRLELKVVAELSQYEGICRHARAELKQTLAAREAEAARQKLLDRARERSPLSRQHIMHAEAELLKASADMSRTNKELEEQTDLFEKRKLHDLKLYIASFIEAGMIFHSKSLELLTIAHNQILNMDEKTDLHEFRAQLRIWNGQKLSDRQSKSGSLASLLEQGRAPVNDELSADSEIDEPEEGSPSDESPRHVVRKSRQPFYT